MAQNIEIDPAKRDYVVENGSPVVSNRIHERAFYTLAIPRNAWLYGGPDLGSDLYRMRNAKRTADIEALFASRAMEAIESQLIKTGEASRAEVKNISGSRSGTSNNIDIEQNQESISTKLDFSPV